MFYPRPMDDVPLEHCEYRDDGCDLFPSCLNCPLPRCRYDEPHKKQARKGLRNREVTRLHAAGMRITELSERFGVSKRTVHRILAARHGECPASGFQG